MVIHSGSCLCGSVRFTATGPLRGVIYCHCSQCRKQSGHYYAATNVSDQDLSIHGSEKISWYMASQYARRGFCSTCGSVLFWKLNDSSEISVLAGAFDTPSDLRGEAHIFVPDKGDYYEITDGLPQYERSSPDLKVAGD
ncbi:MAG: GFA family protein [Rhizobiaceae bacterium]|nr:GFA family protein [Rhizobiaceae bacterium]